jgi:enoyl-CoA hydratase
MGNHIKLSVVDHVATITIDRPERKNAMTYGVLNDFIATVSAAGADPEVRVVLVTGVPGSFCAGTDLSDLNDTPEQERGLRGSAAERRRWWPLIDIPQPTICAVDGPAVGMGAEFTSQCDLRLCSPTARFAWNFVHRGLVPDTGAGTWLLPRLLGPQRAMELIYTGRFLGADEAKSLGYVLDVIPSDELVPRAQELARSIALGSSPLSTRLAKSLVYEAFAGDVSAHMVRHTEAMTTCFASDDHHEGVASFLERRPPVFTGR